MGNGATVLLIVFCAPPTCNRLPACRVPPKPAGSLKPSGTAKFLIGNVVGVAAGDKGPPVKLRSTANIAKPPLERSRYEPRGLANPVNEPSGDRPPSRGQLRLAARSGAVSLANAFQRIRPFDVDGSTPSGRPDDLDAVRQVEGLGVAERRAVP